MYFINRFWSGIAERRSRPLLLWLLACAVIALSACQSEPPAIETVEVTSEVAIEVTRIVPSEVEVTREVPVTRVVTERVESTREVPVTRVVTERVEVAGPVVEVEVIKEVIIEVPVTRVVTERVEVAGPVVEVEVIKEVIVEVPVGGISAEDSAILGAIITGILSDLRDAEVPCSLVSEIGLGLVFGPSRDMFGRIGIPACYRDGSYVR